MCMVMLTEVRPVASKNTKAGRPSKGLSTYTVNAKVTDEQKQTVWDLCDKWTMTESELLRELLDRAKYFL